MRRQSTLRALPQRLLVASVELVPIHGTVLAIAIAIDIRVELPTQQLNQASTISEMRNDVGVYESKILREANSVAEAACLCASFRLALLLALRVACA